MNAPPSLETHTQRVGRYYDANTSLFRVFEPKGDTIHRAVWGPGVANRRAALAFTNERVAAAAASLGTHDGAPLRLIDMGCGTGGTILWLSDHLAIPWTALAITLSEVQAARARRNMNRRGISDRCKVVRGDYLRVPSDGPFDLAFAIESFVHCHEPALFFQEAARLLRPGARLLICDDVLSEHAAAPSLAPWEVDCLTEFSRYWLAPAPLTARAIAELGAVTGLRLVANIDWTPSLRLLPGTRSPKATTLVRALSKHARFEHPFASSLRGGLALQIALARGLIEYRWMCFERA